MVRRDPRLEAIFGQPIHDPRKYLREILGLMARGKAAGWHEDPEKRKLLLLRRNVHKQHRELRDACIFACLMRQALGPEYMVAPVREQSHPADVFFLWDEEGSQRFCPVQMKELPPGYLNKTARLDAQLRTIAADPPTPDTVVAIYLNRRGRLGEFPVPAGLKLAALWIFGSTTVDSTNWILIGDLLAEHKRWDFPLGL